jgi:hypothetical protein
LYSKLYNHHRNTTIDRHPSLTIFENTTHENILPYYHILPKTTRALPHYLENPKQKQNILLKTG